jgi:hypothetical protein
MKGVSMDVPACSALFQLLVSTHFWTHDFSQTVGSLNSPFSMPSHGFKGADHPGLTDE